MKQAKFQVKIFAALLLASLVVTTPAHAFRCGNRIVVTDMHEAQVRRACGEPTTRRNLGTTVRGILIPYERRVLPGMSGTIWPGHGRYVEEVVVTEYVYNFGPRKLMRRLVFEGGVLVSIETLGYGYLED